MDFQTIETETRGPVAVLYLNRPEARNALSVVMRKEIIACLARWREDREIGAVIVTGRGRPSRRDSISRNFGIPAFSMKSSGPPLNITGTSGISPSPPSPP